MQCNLVEVCWCSRKMYCPCLQSGTVSTACDQLPGLLKEAVHSANILVNFCQTTWCYSMRYYSFAVTWRLKARTVQPGRRLLLRIFACMYERSGPRFIQSLRPTRSIVLSLLGNSWWTYDHGNWYPCNSRETAGSSVFYAVHDEAIYAVRAIQKC
jgi:hypothetical protein